LTVAGPDQVKDSFGFQAVQCFGSAQVFCGIRSSYFCE